MKTVDIRVEMISFWVGIGNIYFGTVYVFIVPGVICELQQQIWTNIVIFDCLEISRSESGA